MLDNTNSTDTTATPSATETSTPAPATRAHCFVGETAVLTTFGLCRISDLAALSAARDQWIATYAQAVADAESSLAHQLATIDAHALNMHEIGGGVFGQSFDSVIAEGKLLHQNLHDDTVAALNAACTAQCDATLPRAIVYDPNSGNAVERAFVQVWAQPDPVSELVDVPIDTRIIMVNNMETEQHIYVRCTPDHVFITTSGDVQAQQLTGQTIRRVHPDGAVDTYLVPHVLPISLNEPVTVYDATVEGIASFCVAPEQGPTAVVHNSSYIADTDSGKDTPPLPVARLFSLTRTEYEWRDVTVDFRSGKTVSCRVPVKWSANAAATLMSKYAVRAGVPDSLGGVDGREVDAERIFDRLVAGWRDAAVRNGYWRDDDPNLAAFCVEIKAMLEQQVAAPNSPQWFNTGVAVQYGIRAGSDGHYKASPNADGHMFAHLCTDSLEYPQVSACFIQSVSDSLVGEGGIMDLWTREARLFKYGSGSGSNVSSIRGKNEPLSRGGSSSGLLSFLRVGDQSAGAIKSAGTTRRAAKMIIVDDDHPDIEDFIGWKPREDAKIRALHAAGIGDPKSFEDEATETVSGQNANNSVAVSDAFMQAVINDEPWDLRARVDGSVTKTVRAAGLWAQIVDAAWQCADPGLQFSGTLNAWHTCKADGNIRGSNPCCLVQNTLVHTEHGYRIIADLAAMYDRGQALPRVWAWENGAPVLRQCLRAWKAGDADELCIVETMNNTVIHCTPEHRFLVDCGDYIEAQYLSGHCLANGDEVYCVHRVLHVTNESREAVYDIEVEGAHNFMVTGDPETPPVVVHNSEYVFLDDTACNLASLNLAKFVILQGCTVCEDRDGGCAACRGLCQGFHSQAFEHAVRLWTIVLDISVSMAGYPTAEIARRSMLYRTLGLGYAALGETLVMLGLGYGTEQGRKFAADLTSLMTCTAYRTSVELARHLGPFPRYNENAADTLNVLRKHDAHSRGALAEEWRKTIKLAREYGVRNAQVTLLAPTGTIGIVMDCETTGIEPYYSDSIIKSLAGGGIMRFASERFATMLREHGYDPEAYTERAWTIEDGAIKEYVWIVPPTELAEVLVCAPTLTPEQHIDMMAAVQPFLSGAISKTVNMPSNATREDVAAMYMRAWKSGLKSIAIYRDGCKPAQPLQGRTPPPDAKVYTSRETAESALSLGTFIDAVAEAAPGERARLNMRGPGDVEGVTFTFDGEPITALGRGERELPPDESVAHVRRLSLGGHTLYLTMSEYDDGRLAAIFVTSPRTGSTTQGWVNTCAKLFSLALQHGTPLDVLTSALRGEQFEPSGYLNGRPVTSPVDAFARLIDERYLTDDPENAPTLVDGTKQHPTVAVRQVSEMKPTGNACDNCGSLDLARSGTCFVCKACGSTTGCS